MTLTILDQAPNISDLKVHSTQINSKLIITPPLIDHDEAITGNFYICEDQIYFFSEQQRLGIAVEYPDIIMHAISRSENEASLFCQLDMGLFFPNQQLPESELEREEIATELTIVPGDESALDAIYQAMSTCASLHPDEGFTGDNEEAEGAIENNDMYYTDDIDESQLNGNQLAALRHLESVFEGEFPPINGTQDEDKADDKE